MNLADKIAKELGLTFINQKTSEGNLCFAKNNEELRPEFKEIFTASDLSNYEFALLYSEKYKADLIHDLLPKDRAIFWKLVTLGNNLKCNLE